MADRAVLANAYVSGMKEDINLEGNQYNLLVTCLSVGCNICSYLGFKFIIRLTESRYYWASPAWPSYPEDSSSHLVSFDDAHLVWPDYGLCCL